MKTKRDLIKTISIVRGNLSHIENTGIINGTLLIEIERVMEEYAQQEKGGKGERDDINWSDFNKKKPNYGDLIILRYPPEAMTDPIITVYGRDTQWLDGDVYAVIEKRS